MNFNKKLLALRKEKGLSQDELGSQLNVSRQTISKWELGETTPEMDKLILISEFFNISLDGLVKGTCSSEVSSKVSDISEAKLDTPKKGVYEIILLLAKIFGMIFLIDAIIMIIYFISNEFPA
ncbi:MAG: helix-turn-helix domain-containing protein [Clostridiaceae bacterium]